MRSVTASVTSQTTQAQPTGSRLLVSSASRYSPSSDSGNSRTADPRYVVTGVSAVCESLWTNADDRLPLASLGRVEGRNGIVEGRDVADVRPEPSVTHPPDDLTQLGAIGLDNKVDRQAVRGPRLRRPDDGHQRSFGSNETRGPLLDLA